MRNTAIGVGALQGNITGNFNTAIGDRALQELTTDFSTRRLALVRYKTILAATT